MKVTIQSENIVSLSPSECKRVAIQYFCTELKWSLTYYIGKEKKVYDEVECLGSHSFTTKKFVREATEQDYLTEKLLLAIK
tara:strand:- start:380 stop:622 length:243 start_codon:yes stop_codon:yes gene_type:complete